MVLIHDLAAASRDEKRCAETLHISQLIERINAEMYPAGATDVRTTHEHWDWLMGLSEKDFRTFQDEQTVLWTEHHKRVIEMLRSPDLLPWEDEETARILRERVWYPDMDYEGKGYPEPDWDDEDFTNPTMVDDNHPKSSPGSIAFLMRYLNDEPDELPF